MQPYAVKEQQMVLDVSEVRITTTVCVPVEMVLAPLVNQIACYLQHESENQWQYINGRYF